MTNQTIAPQFEFESLEDFASSQNNFYAHFLNDCYWGAHYRRKAHFKRFEAAHPELEKTITEATVAATRSTPSQPLPYDQLWEAYKLMTPLVYVDDEDVIREGKPDKLFLLR